MTTSDKMPFSTIKCPYCGNKLAYPFNKKSQKCCIKCGASIDDIERYYNCLFNIFIKLLKYGIPIILMIILIDFLSN